MKLFHLSNAKMQTLQPIVGASRHGGEDPRAVGKAVVWLSNDASMRRTDDQGNHASYQHEIDLDVNDPDLFLDQPFDAMMLEADAMFGRTSTLRWYFCLRSLPVAVVRIWDTAQGRYV